jgi:hypothetical protein
LDELVTEQSPADPAAVEAVLTASRARNTRFSRPVRPSSTVAAWPATAASGLTRPRVADGLVQRRRRARSADRGLSGRHQQRSDLRGCRDGQRPGSGTVLPGLLAIAQAAFQLAR